MEKCSENLVVGFDAKRIVKNGTGLGSYGRTLVNDLAADERLQLRLYAPDKGRDDLRNQIAERPNVTFCYPSHHTSHSTLHIPRFYWRTRGIVGDLRRDGVQVYHGLSGELPVGIRKSGIRSIVTIHDLIFLRHPEFYHWLDTKIYAWKFRRTIREADHIIAISECTKRDIIEFGDVSEDKISVIYQSFSPRFSIEIAPELLESVRQRYQLPNRYVLNVGTIEARKNILLAIKALAHLPEEISLVVVGRRTKYSDKVLEYAKKHGLMPRIKFYHGVPDDDLPATRALVFPSSRLSVADCPSLPAQVRVWKRLAVPTRSMSPPTIRKRWPQRFAKALSVPRVAKSVSFAVATTFVVLKVARLPDKSPICIEKR